MKIWKSMEPQISAVSDLSIRRGTMSIGANIRRLREEKEFTQEKIADELGVSSRQYRPGKEMNISPISTNC